VEDVTETMRKRLADTEIALRASNEELEAFCYSVAHDLRAPLRGIQGFSEALLDDYATALDAKGQDYLTRVSAAALRMSELIDDLLALSRISRGPLQRGPVDLSAIARAATRALEQQSPARKVHTVIADHLIAIADERLMQIVLEHLLENAWKFTAKNGTPAVEVGAATIDGAAAFFVKDNGAGFDEAYATRLFAPFQRLHPEKEFPGTGIGLATVQRIVRRHGGRVWANAAIDRGATIYFTLPDGE
jgi:light-regulated signal transduction histidine kinase (bacteriophytochrome)